MNKKKYKLYYYDWKNNKLVFMDYISYNQYEELFYKYDNVNWFRVFIHNYYVLIINTLNNAIMMNKA